MFSAPSLWIEAATFSCAASSDWAAIGGFPTRVTLLDVTPIRRTLRCIGFGLLTTVIFPLRSQLLDSIIQELSQSQTFKVVL